MKMLHPKTAALPFRRAVLIAMPLLVLLLTGCAGSADWSSEFVLDDADASSPTTAVDERTGTVYWSWFGKDGDGRSGVFVSSLGPSDDAPSEPVRVDPSDPAVNPHPQAPPQVAVAPDGTVYAAWSTRIDVEGRRFPASNLQIARSTDGGRTFAQPVYVNDDYDGAPAGHTFHNMAVGPDGAVYVSWLDSRQPETTTVRIARSADGGRSFDPGVIVASGSCQCCRTGLHIDDEGTVYIMWRHIFDHSVRDIVYARSSDGARTFSAPIRVHEDNWQIDGCPHSGPSVTTDPDGRLHAAWYTAAPNRTGLYHAVSMNGGASFGAPEPLVTGVPISDVGLSRAAVGAWLVWEDARSGSIYAREASASEDDVLRFEGSSPSIASARGRTAIAWERDGRVLAVVSR